MVEYKYWDDMKEGSKKEYGPLVFSTQLLDNLLEMMGEKHPIHTEASFATINNRKQRIIPGGFIHSITSGWIVQRGSATAVVGMRSMHWSFVRPLYPDTEFWFSTEVTKCEAINDRLGRVDTTRRVFGADNKTYAIGKMSAVIRRRPRQKAELQTASTSGEA